MRYSSRALVLVLALAPGFCAVAQPAVSVAPDGSVTVDADRAPLSDVLDRFARATGAQLTWEGTPPRALVTIRVQAPHPAAALAAILEGQALDYAVALDLTGTRVTTLILGSAPTSAGTRPAGGPVASDRPSPAAAGGRRPVPLRPPEPAADEEAPADTAPEASEAATNEETAAGGETPAPAASPTPEAPARLPGSPLGPGPVRFPVSPFAPQPTPLPTPPPAAQPTPTP